MFVWPPARFRIYSPPSRGSDESSWLSQSSAHLGSDWSSGLDAEEWHGRKYHNPCPEFSAEVAEHLEAKLTVPSVLLIILDFMDYPIFIEDTTQAELLEIINQKTSLPLVLTTIIHEYLQWDTPLRFSTSPRDHNAF